MIGIGKLASSTRRKRGRLVGGQDIRLGLVKTLLATDPFGGGMVIVVTVRGKTITQRAERSAVLVVTAFEEGEGDFVAIVTTDTDGA